MDTLEDLLTVNKLRKALDRIRKKWGPGCRVMKNAVGNLIVFTRDGSQVGWLDLRTGKLDNFASIGG